MLYQFFLVLWHPSWDRLQSIPSIHGFLSMPGSRWTVERKVGRCPSADPILGRGSPMGRREVDSVGFEVVEFVIGFVEGTNLQEPPYFSWEPWFPTCPQKNRPNETISRWFQTVFLRRYGDEHPTYPTYPAWDYFGDEWATPRVEMDRQRQGVKASAREGRCRHGLGPDMAWIPVDHVPFPDWYWYIKTYNTWRFSGQLLIHIPAPWWASGFGFHFQFQVNRCHCWGKPTEWLRKYVQHTWDYYLWMGCGSPKNPWMSQIFLSRLFPVLQFLGWNWVNYGNMSDLTSCPKPGIMGRFGESSPNGPTLVSKRLSGPPAPPPGLPFLCFSRWL